MLQAIRSFFDDEQLRAEKVKLGYEQLKKFSWQKTADLTIRAYKEALSVPALSVI